MKILFFFVHPAGYHLVKNIVNQLKAKGHELKILIVKKDVLEDLVKSEGWAYTNIFPEGRRSTGMPILVSTAVNLMKTEARLFKQVRAFKPDLMFSDDGSLAHVGTLLRIPTLLFNEDDVSAVWEHNIVYPFAAGVLAPACCDVGVWKKKKIAYDGYHELAYLHPKYFTPDREMTKAFNPQQERYFLLRLAELTASHDVGNTGITRDVARRIVAQLKPQGKVFITSERLLEEEFEPYRIKIAPTEIFHALYYADLYIGDSQTMAAEAAVLGTPSIRFNNFVGKLGYLEELEHKYQLTFGIRPAQPDQLFAKIDELLQTPNLKEQWQAKRQRLLNETIDVTAFMADTIEKFPASRQRS